MLNLGRIINHETIYGEITDKALADTVAIPQYFEKKKIGKEKIVSPDPAIAVPLVEAMRYVSHKSELREIFVNLLGVSMNSDCIDEHPSFVEIIKQLSSGDCKILKHLYKHKQKRC